MAINALNGFKIGGKDPIDTRLVFETEAEMKAFDGYLPDAYFAVTKDTGKFWVYKADRTGDKWIELVGGESTPYSAASPWVVVENQQIDISDDAKTSLSAVEQNADNWTSAAEMVEENYQKWNSISNIPESAYVDDKMYGMKNGTWTVLEEEPLSAGEGITIKDGTIASHLELELTTDKLLDFKNAQITI